MSNAELIADARQLIRHSSVSVPEHANMLGRLADALEAAEGGTVWEYGVHLGASDEVRAHSTRGAAVADARAVSTIIHPDGGVEIFERTLMRRKAGPWEPVEGETND